MLTRERAEPATSPVTKPLKKRVHWEESHAEEREQHAAERITVTLRTVAEKVGLAPCSVSAVLNNSPAAVAIPQRTKIASCARLDS